MGRISHVWTLIGVAAAMAILSHGEIVRATPASVGFSTTFILKGVTFEDFDVFNHATKKDLPAGFDGKHWLSLQKTKGPSDLYIVNNTWKPVNFDGLNSVASTGWHTHPGHSLITVTAGTLTEYEGEACIRHIYIVGDTFVDPGDGHVHNLRNEGTVAASTIAVQLVPSDPSKANRRIDEPAPARCAFIE
jgi:hypothetical protein